MPQIEILPEAQQLAEHAAGHCLRLMEERLGSAERFTLVLAGGSTPKKVYACLAAAKIEWRRVHFFWGDERCVPPDAPDSNYGMAQETLFRYLPVPPENIHRMAGEYPAKEAAHLYEEDLQGFFGNGLPRFDLVLLGLGTDGHSASLFPGSSALRAGRRWAVPVQHAIPPPPLVERVTLTLPVLNNAAHVIFLVAGADKADILAEVLEGPHQPRRYPAQGVRPANGSLLWLADAAAAKKLTPASA
jgi:6-phosphogluconolactonase